MSRDGWIRADVRTADAGRPCECESSKQREARSWNRTIFVPDGMQPLGLITECTHGLPLPPFHAGQTGVNKFDVECIASAMLDPDLRWLHMYYFVIAPYDGPAAFGDEYGIELGEMVLVTGHHRFLAWLLAGVPPSDTTPLQVQTAPLSVAVFPWSAVEWGA
ncbi:MAG: hypothetical protein JXB47_16780 [Anaerolineae bacterium]|nr:hypothetical protein [Anaerolineae bacterium]